MRPELLNAGAALLRARSVRVAAPTLAAAVMLVCAGCNTNGTTYLNEPSRSVLARNVVTLAKAEDIPYERIERGGLAVSYSLAHYPSGNVKGYRMTLVIRNSRQETVVINPSVTLTDGTGLAIMPMSVDDYFAVARTLAGTQAPPRGVVASQPQQPVSHSGTITNTQTGQHYTYSGTSGPSGGGGFNGAFNRAFAEGYAQAAANAPFEQAMERQRQGLEMMQWANAFWLRSTYSVPPGTSVAGALWFPVGEIRDLPLHLSVEIEGERFEFTTIKAQASK